MLDLEELATMDSSGIGLLSRFLTATKQQTDKLSIPRVRDSDSGRILNLFEYSDSQAATASFLTRAFLPGRHTSRTALIRVSGS